MLFGIAGTYRREELYNMKVREIQERAFIIINILDTRIHIISRTFYCYKLRQRVYQLFRILQRISNTMSRKCVVSSLVTDKEQRQSHEPCCR